MRKFLQNFVHVPGFYKDVIDGSVYQENSAHIKQDGSFPISLYWHLDGAPALKSKSVSIWPIQSFVAELPVNIRYSYKNIILSGLWFGKKKPDMFVFQEQFVQQIEELKNGFQVGDPEKPKFKLSIVGQAADLIAKGPSINFKIFCGKFGCSDCLHPGLKLPCPGNVRIYLPRKFPRRNHEDSLDHAKLADITGEATFGIKGSSPVHRILKIPEMLLFDYMHQVLEGEYTRRLTKWLNGKCPSETSIKNSQRTITTKLLNIKLPHDFKRKFRPIEEFSKWKASEKQALFLHTGLPILKTVLPPELFYHHCLLVTGIRMLCNDTVSENDICIADAMIGSYTRCLPKLFSRKECTYNSHALTHLPQQVREHGPLILHSTFVFESMLAHLKRMFHGTRGIPEQICKRLAIAQHSKSYVKQNTCTNPAASEFVEKLLEPSNLVEINDGIKLFPPLMQQPPELNGPIEGYFHDERPVIAAQRMAKGGHVYHSLCYRKKGNSASYLVAIRSDQDDTTLTFGEVQYFLKDGNSDGFAVVRVIEPTGSNICSTGMPPPADPVTHEFWSSGVLGQHFLGIRFTRRMKLIKCTAIECKVVYIEHDDAGVDGYVSSTLNSYQHD